MVRDADSLFAHLHCGLELPLACVASNLPACSGQEGRLIIRGSLIRVKDFDLVQAV